MSSQERQTPLGLVFGRLKVVKKRGHEYFCHCPAHEDKTPSLTVTTGDDERVLIHCHAGCSPAEILAKIGLEAKDLFPDSGKKQDEPGATYDYVDTAGKLRYQVCRYPGKKFAHRRPAGSGGWIWDTKGVERVPYNLPAVLKAIECSENVYIAEGEKDADELAALGLTATTNSGGAGKWTDRLAAYFKDANAIVLPDNDEPGKDHAKAVAKSLEGVATSVKLLELPGLDEKQDVSDWLAAGGTKATLLELSNASAAPALILDRGDSSAELLEAIREFVSRYVVFEKAEQAVAVSLWIAHSHVIEAADCTPYMAITSPEPRCGKSRLLEVMELLTPRAIQTANVSDAALFRIIDQDRPTILFDEVDAVFAPKTGREDLRALLNVGHRRGATVLRCEAAGSKQAVCEYDAFAAKALAAIGTLPSTIEDRSISVRLQRRTRGESVERFRQRLARRQAEPVRKHLEAWSENAVDRLKDAWPELPEELNDRAQDGWEPLLAIADAAGGRWPQLARNAAVVLQTDGAAADASDGVLLLEHLRGVFADTERLPTVEVLARLVAVEDGPWGEWWGASVAGGETKGAASRLARSLKPFGIGPKKIRLGEETARGYERAQFEDAWRRYLEPGSLSMENKDGTHGTSQVDTQIQNGTEENPFHQNTASEQVCSVVPSPRTEQGDEQGSGGWKGELEI